MTSKRFLHKKRRGLYSSAKSAQMNKARWDADLARRDEDIPERIRELAEVGIQNLPCKHGDAIGCLQWTEYSTGKVRRWIIRRGSRVDQVTMENMMGKRTASHGWTWVMSHLRPYLCGHKFSQ